MNTAKIINSYCETAHENHNGSVSIICPFHNDQQASLNADLRKGILYCFGCGWKGDIIEFVAQREKVNRLKALQLIMKIDKQALTRIDEPVATSSKELLRNAYLEYKKSLFPDWNSFDNYLVGKRGVSSDTLKKLEVGYGFDKYGYNFIIPIREDGKFAGYVKTGEGVTPKYLYNKGFNRSQVLWGNIEEGIVFVTEGVIDYIKARQFGQENAVCLLGWKASLSQLNKIKGATDTVISALDNDEKGEEGTEYLKKHFDVIRFNFPEGIKDIGEMSQQQFENRRN